MLTGPVPHLRSFPTPRAPHRASEPNDEIARAPTSLLAKVPLPDATVTSSLPTLLGTDEILNDPPVLHAQVRVPVRYTTSTGIVTVPIAPVSVSLPAAVPRRSS